MTRLIISVEGQSEEIFVNLLLAPHLAAFSVYASASIVGKTIAQARGHTSRGGGMFRSWADDLRRLSTSDPSAALRLTTLFDLYGLPDDFPGLDIKDPNTLTRCARLEAELAQVVQDHRFIPYIQRHEFEALVLAALDGLELELREDEQLAGLATLTAEVAGLAPEDINDSPLTAPSKRLLKHIPGYKKTRHGPEALRTVGLAPVRKLCPRFDAWVKQLEALGKPPHTP